MDIILIVALLAVVVAWALDHRRTYAAGAAHERLARRMAGH